MVGQGALAAQPIILFNPEGRTANYVVPAWWRCCCSCSGWCCRPARCKLRERERGASDELLVTPIDPLGLMLGKLFPYLVLHVVEMTLILIVMRFGFSVRSAATSPCCT